MNNIKQNFVYNLTYQLLILIIPLIMSSYLSRVIGVEGVGIYSYTYSIVYYFMLFTMLGVNNYGNREIAKVRDNKTKLSSTFCSIYAIQLIMGIVMLLLYILYNLLFVNEYKLIAFLQVFYIISAILDINWLFFGLEEFKKTITKNIIIKISSVILVLLFVKAKNDVWKYTIIMSITTCIGQMLLWKYMLKEIRLTKISKKDIKKHVKSNLVLFIPVVAVSLYKIMDKIMLGAITNIFEVGYYENAEKIVNIPMTLISALGTVMLPRISNIMYNGRNDEVKNYISKSITFIMFMSFAMCCGLIGVGYNFAPLFFGSEFQKTGILIMLLATTLPFLSFANVIRTQYLIPKGKDKIYIISVSLGALVNLIMNLIFIPKMKSIGAWIGTISAEVIVMIYQTISVRRDLNIKEYLKNSIPFFIKALIMLFVINLFNYININGFVRLYIQIVCGGLIYCLLNLKYILNLVDFKKIFKKKNNLNNKNE